MSDLLARVQAALGDGYRVERELGGGGMSRLFIATERTLHRQVVIKLLPPQFTSEVSAARFEQEIQVAARLQHPNILPVLSAGAKDDLLYYIMPYVPGESLRHRLARDGKLPLAHAIRILEEISDALAYAHSEGVIHRDIKPENILLEGAHAVLTDFGVARALVEAGSGRLTETGMVVGTPAYMSPEQAAGESHVDARADVYALAVVGYEMLAGVLPFEGATARALIAAHLMTTPKPLGAVRPDIPPAVTEVIDTA
ncbi:MAG TPA: serine/threonine-protein kinase, partial [Gemmatimonadales bacterium]|nr:serine/threonine-protein kinase [Gemmatimonadales bacterium]